MLDDVFQLQTATMSSFLYKKPLSSTNIGREFVLFSSFRAVEGRIPFRLTAVVGGIDKCAGYYG
jgi:hypothetical protein